jgi:transcriptional regulator with XRE-family HTH domain
MNNLKQYRKKAGLTQTELAAKVGISHRTLQDYEQGRKPLEGAAALTVLKLARVLGLALLSDVENLIGADTETK